MKKLALVVLLAVVASRILADRDDSRPPKPPRYSSFVSIRSSDDDNDGRTERREHPPRPAPPVPPQPLSERGNRNKNKASRKSAPQPAVLVTQGGTPAWFPKSEQEEEALARPDPAGSRVLLGRLSVSPDRATLDLTKIVNAEVSDWLAADVPTSWTPPRKLVNRMAQGIHVGTVTRSIGATPGEVSSKNSAADLDPMPGTTTPSGGIDDLYTFYRAGQKLDFSDARRAEFIAAYHRELASARMRKSGSVIAVVLAALAMVSLYVRTDEATKGYYTNRLRVLAAGGLGAAGVVAYRYWA